MDRRRGIRSVRCAMRLRTMNLLDGTSGSAPAGKCGFLSRKHPVCPAPASAATGAPSYSFGAVLKAADVISAQPGSARCGFAQPRLNLTGQRNNTDERFGLGIPVGATSISGGHRMVRRKIGNPCAEGSAEPSPAKQRCRPADKSPLGFSTDRRRGQAGNANHHRLQCASGH